jgi:DNA helicase-2/ATP-dependent DNA helicase PcrA
MREIFLSTMTDDTLSLIKEIVEGKTNRSQRRTQYDKYNMRYLLLKIVDSLPTSMLMSLESHFQWLVAEIYPDYEKKMKANNALDFDDILLKTRDILHLPSVLEHFQDIFQYFCVDEYQDTNSIQYEIIQLLASKSKNLCVVGDDWQGIYSWRGANIANILNFKHDFPAAEVVKLEQNYRSSSTIINAANVVIKNNQSALDKECGPRQRKVKKYKSTNVPVNEKKLIKSEILSRKIQHQWAILYRTNGQSRVIEEALIRRGVPYEIVGGLKFYDRKEIKDIIAYLKVIMTPTDSVAWKRIVNTPPRKIGPTSMESIMKYVERQVV